MTTTSNPHSLLPALPPSFVEVIGETPHLPDPMEAPGLRWGILGAGGIARTFVEAVENWTASTVAAVAARSSERARAFANEVGVPLAFGSYKELVACDEVDAVYVAVIHPHHEELAMLALDAGKPVLVEKPFTMTAAGARRLVEAARTAGTFLMEAMWTRHLPHQQVVNALVHSGSLGSVVAVRADHGQALRHVPRLVEPELGGGALLDLGVYPVSFVQQILGECSLVTAGGTMISTGVDGQVAAILRAGSALAVATANLDGRSATAAEVVLDNGAVELPLQFYRPGPVRLRTFMSGVFGGETTTWDGTVPGGFQYQVAEFARCVTAGLVESPAMPWSSTVQVMDLLDQIAESIRH